MKKMMRYISVMVLLLCSIVASARGGVEVKVEIASLTNGTITSRMSGQTCTLTVTPAAGYYIRKSDITVQKTVSPSAPLRRGAEIPVTDNLTLKGDEPAAYSAECQYSFDIPEGYNALVTATFTECTAITPAVTLQGWTYGDAANEAEVTGNTGKATVSYSYAVKGGTSFAAATPTDAGNYTVKVAIPAIGIYTAGEATGDFTITAAPVTITTGTASKTYDGTALTTPEANISGLVNNETATVTATGSQTEVGESTNTYTIDWGQTKKANYTVTEQLGKLTVTAASMTVTADGYEGVFDGQAHGVTLKNVPEGSTVTYANSQNGTYSETAPTFTDVCDATSVYYKVTNSNYNDASGSATVKITAAPVTITTGTASKTYDGTALTTPEASITGLVNNETATVTATGSQTEVGESTNTYTIDWGQTKKANYTVTEQLGKLTVTAATMAITADGYEGVYDGQAHGITVKNVPEGSTVTYATNQNGTYSETAPTFTDVCDATSVYYKVTNSNYTAASGSATVTITAAPVTITTGSATKTYDGTALTTPEANISGLVNNETATVTATGSQTEVGESTNTYTIDWGQTKKANYTVTEQLGKLTVTAATMAITADGYEGVYDGKAHGITVKNVPEGSTVTYANSQNGTYSETAPTFTDVCDATSVYYKVTNSNYNDASGSATVTITAAPVTITTGSATKTYDGTPLTKAEANISGLVNNETATVTATGSQTEVGESVNTYTIDWGQTKKANYTVTEQLGKLTVTKKALTITAKNATKVYGTDDPALEYEVDGLVEGDKLEGALVRAEGVNVGTYDILQGTLKASANYAVTFNKGTFTITAAELTGINIDNVTAVYDGKAHSLDVPTNEGVTFKFGTSEGSYEATTAPTLTDVGTLDIFYKAEKANFSPVTGKATVKITPKDVTVSGIEASISTENGVSTVIVDCEGASFTGIVNRDYLTISGVTGTIKETATDGTVTVALDYSKATLGGDHAKNYVLAAIGHQPTVTVTNKKETSVDIAEDGTKTETKTESKTEKSEDGSVTVTENTNQTVTDGQGKVTVTEANTVTETKTDGSTETTSTVVEKDGNNNVTGKIETTKTDDAKGTTTERTVVKDSDGKVTETREIGSSSRTNTDGSSNETTTVTVKDGNDNVVNTKNVTVEKGADGSVKTTESTYQSNTDGTTQETFEETITDEKGAFVESSMVVKETDADGSIIVNEVVAKAVGKDGELHTLYNPNTGEHFYTKNIDEARALVSAGWADETAGRQCEVGLSDDAINRARYEEKSSKITSATGQVQLEKSSKTLTVLKGTDDAKMSLKGAKAGENFRVTCSKGFMLGSNHQLKVKGALIGAPRRADRAPQLAEDEILIESGVEYEILTDEPLVLTLKTTESDVSIESIAISEATTGIRTMSDVRGKKSDVWYTLDGRELDKAPVAKGLYFHGGRKIVVR